MKLHLTQNHVKAYMTLSTISLSVFLSLFLYYLTPETSAQSANEVDNLIHEAERQFKEKNNEQALETFLDALEVDSTNYEALHRTSLLYNLIGYQFDDEDDQKAYYEKAVEYAEKALAHHEGKPESHYVYSIAIGRIAKKTAPRTRVSNAGKIKEHAEKVLDLDPKHAGAWHVLGVWHHQASSLSFAERTAVRMFGGIPPASKEEADEAFEKALKYDRDNILFHLDYARFLEDTGDEEKAIKLLERAVNLQPQIDGDEKFLERSKDMLAALR